MESDLEVELNYLRHWIHQNSKFIIVNCFILCYLNGSWIFSRGPLVDTMLYINIPYSSYNWLSIGREGAVFSKWIFQNMNYNPYLATGVGYIFICLGGILLGYIGYRSSMRCGWLWTFTPLMFLCPIFAEQFYFKLQILEIGWGYILCTSAAGINYYIIFKKKRRLYVLSIIMMIWSFHTYQTFVITYVIMVGIAYIMMCLSGMVNEERRDTTWWALLLEHIVVFGIANVVGQIATSIFFISSGYLESTFLWKTASLGTCFKNIMTHMRLIFFGSSENIFFTAYYGIIAFLVVILIFREFLMNRKVYFFIMLLAAIGIQFTPLLITIYTGSMPSIRGQLNYPLVMIFDGFICFILVSEKAIKWKKFAQIGLSSILVIMLWQQISVTMRLVYTNEVRADEDVWLAQTLNMRLIEMDATNKPVAFIGGYDNMLNAACVRGEIIGRSVFSMFTDSEPHYTASTWHACSVMNTIGIQMRQADDSQIECARRIAVNMPIWPARDSVLDMEDYVIVKLGTEQWAEEIMAVDSMPISEEQVQYTNNLAATINPIRYNGNETLITGWCFGEDIIPCDFISKVYLKHNESRQFCLSGTSAVKR